MESQIPYNGPMNAQRPMSGMSIRTEVNVRTVMWNGSVFSTATTKFEDDLGVMREIVQWEVNYQACRHLAHLSHHGFYWRSLTINRAIVEGKWADLQCDEGCPVNIEIKNLGQRTPTIIRL